jgi:capsular exopolysaccharide synthesis family protein
MNPRVKTLDRRIENLKGVISENLKFSVKTTRNELKDLNTKLENLRGEFSGLPQTQRMLLGMERKFNLTDAVYTSLMEKRIQAQIARASNLPDCEIIEPAHYSSIAFPKTIIMYAVALVLGLIFPLIYILFRRVLTDKIYNKEEVKRYTSLPEIGVLPRNNKNIQNVIINNPKSPIYEAFQSVRSNLLYFMYGETQKVILVTSSLPAEGKSFISLNLATSFASTHSKTILVQFDLRKQTDIFEELNTKALVGMSSYLINRATLDEVIIPTGIPNLDIIQPGQLPPNPIELLSTKKTGKMIQELKERYDYVIIDTPPYGLVTDSFLLMNYVDIKIFVARLGVVTKKAFSTSMEELQSKKIENLYLLLNDVSTGKIAYNQYLYSGKGKKKKAGLFKRK